MKNYRSEMEKKLLSISKFTFNNYARLPHIGSLSGRSGVALFQFYCAKYFDDDTFSDKGVEIIASCIDEINEGYNTATFCNGIAGFGWALQHLYDNDFIDLNADELLNPLDDFLINQMRLDFNNTYYDFLHGAMGYSFYFLKRYSSSTKESAKKRYLDLLEELLVYLENTAIINDDKMKWKSIIDPAKGNIGINLSLSHGMASILNILSRLHGISFLRKRAQVLINGTLAYFNSIQSNEANSFSLFSGWVGLDKNPIYDSRVAWCYGDLGISLSLLKAGYAINDEKTVQNAMKVAKRTAKRRSQNETIVYDAALCHGSFGIAQVFRHLKLEEPKKFWIKEGLTRSDQDSNGLFKSYTSMNKSYSHNVNLLEGMSGIGLGIIDSLSGTPNNWDECLLLSDVQ